MVGTTTGEVLVMLIPWEVNEVEQLLLILISFSSYANVGAHLTITAIFNWVSKVVRHRFNWFYLTLLCDWSRKLAPSFEQIRCKNKNNCDALVIRVFPRFKQFGCFHFEFSLAIDNANPCFDWSIGLLLFWFFDPQLKTALMSVIFDLLSFHVVVLDRCTTLRYRNVLSLK